MAEISSLAAQTQFTEEQIKVNVVLGRLPVLTKNVVFSVGMNQYVCFMADTSTNSFEQRRYITNMCNQYIFAVKGQVYVSKFRITSAGKESK